ncbi:unnamed protein product, partial [Aphanomyces euteiches]
MTERTLLETMNKLQADGSNYREWCVKTRAKINQQRLGKYLKPCRDSAGTYLSSLSEEDDLVALSYIQLSIHNDHLKYIQHVGTTYDTWEALRTIYESTSEVNLVTLQLQLSKLEWSERTGLENFTDQFQEFTRNMTAAGDATPMKSHINRFLCLLPPRFANTVMFIARESRTSSKYDNMASILAELKLDAERQHLSNPSLRKQAGRSDDALNATTNVQCQYCNKPGHIRPECRRRKTDEANGIHQRLIQEKPQASGHGWKGNQDQSRSSFFSGGRGRGQSQQSTSVQDHSNQAENSDDDDEVLFMVEEDVFGATQLDRNNTRQAASVETSNAILDEACIDELCQYVTSNDVTDECNTASMIHNHEAIIDSGATAHMTGDINLLHGITNCARGVRLADGHSIQVTTMGDLKIKSTDTGRVATFKNVLYVPSLKKTLVSISRINRQSDDTSITFKSDQCLLK